MVGSRADVTSIGPSPHRPRGVWRVVRGAVVLSSAWTILALVLTTSTLFALLTLRMASHRYLHLVTRVAGRAVLGLAGIRVRVLNRERIQGRRMRIVALNHASQLDMFVFASLMPPGGTAVAKKEMLWIPFIGWTLFAFDVPTVDRSNKEKARLSLTRVAAKLRDRQASVMFAPEGTRSRDGKLAPFKMGLFHLAAQTGAPIVPAVVRGAKECQPMGRLVPEPGVVEVELLPEIDTTGFNEGNLHEARDALREVFARALEAG